MDENDPQVRRVWNQRAVPVVVRGGRVRPLLVRLPFDDGNRTWLRNDRPRKPEWVAAVKAWSIPKAWFDDTLRRAVDRYHAVYVIQPVKSTETCAPACWNAVGAECECSCLGANHGAGDPAGKWHVVSETFAVRINARQFSCRLLRAIAGKRASPPLNLLF